MVVWIAELKKLPTLAIEWVAESSYFPIKALIACRTKLIASRTKVARNRKFVAFLHLEGREDAFDI